MAMNTGTRPGTGARAPEEDAPFLGSWRNIYAAVLLYLAGLILLCHLFTEHYS